MYSHIMTPTNHIKECSGWHKDHVLDVDRECENLCIDKRRGAAIVNRTISDENGIFTQQSELYSSLKV